MKKNNYATKDDLKSMEKNLKGEMGSMKFEMKELENKLSDRILDTEVKILGELQKMRDDDAAHKFSHMRINDDIQELQDRVGKIEKTNSPSPLI